MKEVVTTGDGGELCTVGNGREVCVIGNGREVASLGLPGPGKVYNDLSQYTFNDLDITYNQVDQTL